MKKQILLCIAIFFVNYIFCQETIFDKPLSERVANYIISAKYSEKNHLIEAKMQLEWTNTSPDTLKELWFYTPMNAFKNTQSSLMKNSTQKISNNFGWTSIIAIEQDENIDLSENHRYIQPDDGNESDQTLVALSLKNNLLPGNKIKLEITFQTQMPKHTAGVGFANDYVFAGMWFPKICVYSKNNSTENKYKWLGNQNITNVNQYADFSTYTVDITISTDFKVGSTGLQTDEKHYNNGTKTLFFRAEDVTDFAWTASKNFIEERLKWEHVNIHILADKEHSSQIKRYKETILKALPHFDENIGSYPYPTLTIISPPVDGISTEGDVYPCLLRAGTMKRFPNGVRVPEMTTINQFAKQYFSNIISPNPNTDEWLTNGLATYYETVVMDLFFGVNNSVIDLYGLQAGDFQLKKYQYSNNILQYAYSSSNFAFNNTLAGYFENSTDKTVIWLHTLDGLVERTVMTKILTNYYTNFKHKHAQGTDFVEIVNQIVTNDHGDKYGANLNWFFEQMLHENGVCDYAVESITFGEAQKEFGAFEKDGKPYLVQYEEKQQTLIEKIKSIFKPKTNNATDTNESKVTISRRGDIHMPIEILIHFDSGKEVHEFWDGKEASKIYTYKLNEKVDYVQIDPKERIAIDRDILNNSYSIKNSIAPSAKWTTKFLFWAQNAIQFFAMLV